MRAEKPTMRIFLTFLLLLPALPAASTEFGAPLASSTGGSLYRPAPNVIGKTAPTRAQTLSRGRSLDPAGSLSPASAGGGLDGSARDVGERPIERRLDCYEGASMPDRDDRNRFLRRCPSNRGRD